MTDKKKLDAIRAEIHRLVNVRGYDREMANDLLAFMDSLPNETVSEDLGEYLYELSKQFPEVSFAKLSRIGVRVAKWQKEQMMAKAKSGTVQKDNQVIFDNGTYMDLDPSMQLKPSFVGLKEGDRIKVIVIKED